MKVLIADDHPLFREGMQLILRQIDEHTEILEAESFPEAIDIAKSAPDFDLVLLDLDMPGSDGAASVKQFSSRHPDIPVVVISGNNRRDDIENVLNSGAMGFISKMSARQEMVSALRLVLEGGIYLPPQLLSQALGQMQEDRRGQSTGNLNLTSRQMDVLKQLAKGLSNKEIALVLGLADGTVKVHVAAILQALGARNRIEAIQISQRQGLLTGDEFPT